jgi:Kef-type K+ transport system membrane component KefB
MTVLLYILLASAVALALGRWLKLPAVPLLLIAGVGLRLTGLIDDDRIMRDTLLLGLTFLVFFAGTELNPARTGQQARAALIVGLVQFFTLAAVGTLTALALGFQWQTSLYVGLALTASSTLVGVTVLRQRQQLFEPFGRLVVGVLLLQDVLVIIAIGGLSGVSDGAGGVFFGLLATFGMILLAWVCARWVMPWLLLRLDLDDEGLLLVVLAILFAFVGLSQVLGLPLVIGGFLAGVALSGFPVNGLVRGQVSSLADFFLAVFFVSLGASLGWLQPESLALAALLIVMVLVITPPLVAWTARLVGRSSRVGIESGLLLAQCSEFSLIVALLGVQQQYMSEDVFTVVTVVTVVTMILTPFVATDAMTWRLMRLNLPGSTRRHAAPQQRPGGHVLMLGCGNSGRQLVDALRARGERVVVVEDDPAIVAGLREAGVEVIRGDGADYTVLRDAGARSAKAIVSTMRRTSDHERMLRFVWEDSVPVLLRTFGPDAAEQVAVFGAMPIIESQLGADAVLRWFDERFAAGSASGVGQHGR